MGICALLRQIFASGLARRALFALLIITLFLGGVQLRRWIGGSTRHVRYQHDIVNAFYWGSEALKEARRLSPNDGAANSLTGVPERLRSRLSPAATSGHGNLGEAGARPIPRR
jgi:hypothetical protein